MSEDRAEQVLAAFAVVLGDLQRPTPIDLRHYVDAPVFGGDRYVLIGGSGYWIDGANAIAPTGEALLVDVADFTQEHVIPEMRETWGQARPPCPGHPHASQPICVEGEAWWRCPRTEVRLGRIGYLYDDEDPATER